MKTQTNELETSNITMEQFTQSQSHGLIYDNMIRVNVFKLPACKNDTKKYDVSCSENIFDKEENISIKTSGSKNIDCGDILRFYDLEEGKKVTIILVRYTQNGNNKKIQEIIEINYNEKLREILFGTIPRSFLEGFVNYVKAIPRGQITKEQKNIYLKCKNKAQKEFNMRINISPKVDSKNQRRVQCSIPKIDELLHLYPEFIISRTNECIIRGVKIEETIMSLPRIRTNNKLIIAD